MQWLIEVLTILIQTSAKLRPFLLAMVQYELAFDGLMQLENVLLLPCSKGVNWITSYGSKRVNFTCML